MAYTVPLQRASNIGSTPALQDVWPNEVSRAAVGCFLTTMHERVKNRLLRLQKAALAEIKSYTRPPTTVAAVMHAVFTLLSYPEEEVEGWPMQKGVFIRDNVWGSIVGFDPMTAENRATAANGTEVTQQ